MAKGLHGIGVNGDVSCDLGDCLDVGDDADLVVHPHQANKRDLIAEIGNQLLEVGQVNLAGWQQVHGPELSTLVLTQPLNRIKKCVVLNGTGDDDWPLGILISCPVDALDGLVIGLGTTGIEDDLAAIAVDGQR